MEVNWIDLGLFFVTQLFAAGVAYGAIRSDLRSLRKDVTEARQVGEKAHGRIDKILMRD